MRNLEVLGRTHWQYTRYTESRAGTWRMNIILQAHLTGCHSPYLTYHSGHAQVRPAGVGGDSGVWVPETKQELSLEPNLHHNHHLDHPQVTPVQEHQAGDRPCGQYLEEETISNMAAEVGREFTASEKNITATGRYTGGCGTVCPAGWLALWRIFWALEWEEETDYQSGSQDFKDTRSWGGFGPKYNFSWMAFHVW